MEKRLENLSKQEQIKTFICVHNRLNKLHFGNELHKATEYPIIYRRDILSRVYIDIAHIDREKLALYCFPPKDRETEKQCFILYNDYWISHIVTKCETINDQKEQLLGITLHEMIHQFMHEKGEDTQEGREDLEHSDKFIQEERKHGILKDNDCTLPILNNELKQLAHSIRFITI